MTLEQTRPAYEQTIIPAEAAKSLVNGNLYRLLPGHPAPYAFIKIRRRIGRRTQRYSDWLAFETREAAVGWVALIKRQKHGLEALYARIARELDETKAKLESNLAAGLFDIGRLEENRRRKQAELYLHLCNDIKKLNEE